MKHFYLLLIILFFNLNGFSQTSKTVIISLYQSKVPEGKIWKIEKDKPIVVEFSNFDKYSICGASIQSYPGLILILSGKTQPFKVHEIYFKNLRKSAFANSNTYTITPIEDAYFYPGTYLLVEGCLRNIEIEEYNLTKQDIENRKLEEIRKKQQEEIEAEKARQEEIDRQKQLLFKISTTQYQLEKVNSNNFIDLKNRIKQIIIEHYKKSLNSNTINIRYQLVFTSDTAGNQNIDLIKISGSELDSIVISELKSLNILKPQIEGYFLSTIAHYDIDVDLVFVDVRFRKYWDRYTYPNPNFTPSQEIKNLIPRKFYFNKNGRYKVKIYDRKIMGEYFTDFVGYK